MKKLVAKLLVLTLMMSLFSIPTNALTADEAAIEAVTLAQIDTFVEKSLALKNPDEFVNMLVLLRDVDNETDFVNVYKAMFETLLDGQEERLVSFGVTIDAANGFGNYFMNEIFSISNLEDYLGLDAADPSDDAQRIAAQDPEKFRAALVRRSEEFSIAINKANVDDLAAGFDRMDKLFGMLDEAATLNQSEYAIEFLKYDDTTKKLSVDRATAPILIIAANLMLENKIENGETVIGGLEILTKYFNGEEYADPNEQPVTNQITIEDKIRILTYLGRYGFVKYPVPEVIVETETVTRTVTRTIIAEETITIEDFVVPLGGGIFKDLFNRFSWAQISIRQLYIAEIFKGKGADTFDPSGFITRAEFAAVLTRMFEAEIPTNLAKTFEDVLSPAWFVDEIEAAYRAGYVKGVGAGLYAPYQNISKEQIATMIARVLEDKGVKAPLAADYDTILSKFIDVDSVSEWAKPGSAMCADLGIVIGSATTDDKTKFGFGDYATRAEVAVILYRIVEKELAETKVVVFGSENDAPVE